MESTELRQQDQLKEKDVTYPIAEIFTSLQGEGVNVGAVTTFIRLAGCSVGKRNPASNTPQYEVCRRYDSESFVCDTDFRMTERLSVPDIVAKITPRSLVCISGGEPFDHNLEPLLKSLFDLSPTKFFNKNISIETSGTKLIPAIKMQGEMTEWNLMDYVHITCSPKANWLVGCITRADELKILIDSHFDELAFNRLMVLAKTTCKVYLQPINFIKAVNKENLNRCMTLINSLVTNRDVRVSIQLHKLLEMR